MAQFFSVHPTHPQPRLIRQAADDPARRAASSPIRPIRATRWAASSATPTRRERIREIRGVDDAHHLTLVCRDLAEIGRFARLDNWQFRIVRQGTPGRFTFLLPATREVPRRLQHPKRSTIGVRVPDHPVVQALLAELGEPILSSTLILPGESEPLNDADAIRDALGTSHRPRHRRRALPGGADDGRRSRRRSRR